jgi:hypothetical protein
VSALLLTLLACGAPEEAPAPDCPGYSVFPPAGVQHVYYRTTVEVTFQGGIDPLATLTLEGVAGSVAWVTDGALAERASLVFTPDGPLSPSTVYEATLTGTCFPEGVHWSFTTGEVGSPVDPAALARRAYALDVVSGRFLRPPGLGSLLNTYVDEDVIVGVVAADATTVTLAVAQGVEDADPARQDTCRASVAYAPAPFDANPRFETSAAAGDLSLQRDYAVRLLQPSVAGDFAPDGSYFVGGVLAGDLDLAGASRVLGGDLCEVARDLGEPCGRCPDGSGDNCVPLYVDNIRAAAIPTAFEVVPTQDAACGRPECADEAVCTPDTAD